jgi:hypothetical protein
MWLPISARQAAVTNPTYPVPTMQTFILGFPFRGRKIPFALSKEHLYIFIKILGKGNLKN